MSIPVVGVSPYRLPTGRVSGWDQPSFALPESYVAALRRAGVRPLMLTFPLDARADETIESFDGLVVVGGGDIDPARYGGRGHPSTYGVDRVRDEAEIELVRAADRVALPTLAICRGIQVVNVAFGGTLHEHLPDVAGLQDHGIPMTGDPILHEVSVTGGSRLHEATGRRSFSCSSHHHQAVDRAGDGLVPVARTEDGLIESLERDGGWLVAVQWHPEETAMEDPAQQAVFDGFATAVRRRVAVSAAPERR
jgi:putative glutamine amidotransferase